MAVEEKATRKEIRHHARVEIISYSLSSSDLIGHTFKAPIFLLNRQEAAGKLSWQETVGLITEIVCRVKYKPCRICINDVVNLYTCI